MSELIGQLADNYCKQLLKFRGVFLGVQNELQSRGRTRLNIAEFVIGYSRGGRRFPLWMINIDASIYGRPFSIDDLTTHGLRDYYSKMLGLVKNRKLVPNSKAAILAAYLSGKICATAASLSEFAGIGISTAHIWLKRSAEIGILEKFQTYHEIFYLNPRLIELALTGTNEMDERFATGIVQGIAELRKRRDWLSESSIFSFYGFDYGQNHFNR